MIIRGILDRSLSSQLCLRGFAPIKTLARISRADYSYQRDLYQKQEGIVKKFLENEKYLFFPEIILSYKFKHIGDVNNNPFRNVKNMPQNKTSVVATSNYDRTKIKIKRLGYPSSDIRGIESLQLAEIELNDEALNALIAAKKEPLHRIDGNHRLTVAKYSDAPMVEKMVVPFCVILGEEYYNIANELIETEDSVLFEKSIRVYFHNINTKSLPLTSEQNLSLILNKKSNFSEEELKDVFPASGIQIRELSEKINKEYFTGIKQVLDGRFLEILDLIFTTLYYLNGEKHSDDIVFKVIEALKTVEQEYLKNDKVRDSKNIGLFIALVYYAIKNKRQYNSFIDWIVNHHLFDVNETKAKTLITIYDKIYEKKIYQLFVAMPYYSHKEVNEYNKLFKEICIDVSRKTKIDLQLIPIMRFKGKTLRIDQRLLDWIDKCDIFVADITGNNLNVIFEVAFADGKGKPMVLIKNESDAEQPPFDMDKLQYIPFANRGYYNDIKSILANNLLAILKDDFHIQI